LTFDRGDFEPGDVDTFLAKLGRLREMRRSALADTTGEAVENGPTRKA